MDNSSNRQRNFYIKWNRNYVLLSQHCTTNICKFKSVYIKLYDHSLLPCLEREQKEEKKNSLVSKLQIPDPKLHTIA